jgi:hypothetical protein
MSNSSNSKASNKQQKKNWFVALALWKKVVIVVVAIAVVVVVVANLATNPSAQASDEFLNSVQAGNSNTAYALLSSGAKTTVTSDDFAKIVQQIGPILNTQETTISKSVSASTGSQPTAQVVYEIKGTDGITYGLTVNLVQENGQWKVLNFDSKRK